VGKMRQFAKLPVRSEGRDDEQCTRALAATKELAKEADVLLMCLACSVRARGARVDRLRRIHSQLRLIVGDKVRVVRVDV